MPYLNLDIDYFENIKTLRLTALLGDEAAIYPLRLWAYCAKHHAKDGYLPGYNAAEIEKIMGWKGEKGFLAGALVQIKLIKKYSTGFKINDWDAHEGHLAAFKERAVKAARSRWDKIAGRSNAQASNKHSFTNAPTIPNLAVPNQTKPTTTTTGGGVASLPETATALEQELAAVGYSKPDPKTEPERALACEYRVLKGISKANWNAWDAQNLPAFSEQARELIRICGGLRRAADCLHDKAAYYQEKKFRHWTIRAVVKYASDWVDANPEQEAQYGSRPDDRQGVSVPNAQSRAERTFDSFGNQPPAAPHAAGVRGLSIVSRGAKANNGHPAPGNEEGRQ